MTVELSAVDDNHESVVNIQVKHREMVGVFGATPVREYCVTCPCCRKLNLTRHHFECNSTNTQQMYCGTVLGSHSVMTCDKNYDGGVHWGEASKTPPGGSPRDEICPLWRWELPGLWGPRALPEVDRR